jgi:hypothetical protein
MWPLPVNGCPMDVLRYTLLIDNFNQCGFENEELLTNN